MDFRRVAIGLAILVTMSANAQERREERREDVFHGRGESYRFDDRYAHDHFYPRRGAYVQALPPGSTSLAFRGDRFFFRAGVWYHPDRGRFVVIAPPVGIVVPLLPPSYATVYVGGAPYYYANGVYYDPVPGQGYVVVDPPPGAIDANTAPIAPTSPEAAVAPQPPQYPSAYPPQAASQGARIDRSAPDPIVYPRNGQSSQQASRDRGECAQWATGQSTGSSEPSMYQRAFEACMDGRGYTVR